MPSTRAQRGEASTSMAAEVPPNAAYGQARQVGTRVATDTASRPPNAETVTASRTTGMITVRLIPVPPRTNRGTAA